MIIAAQQQLTRAQRELDEAARSTAGTEIFLHAHMAALRAAAALTAGASLGRRRRLRSVWEELADLGDPWQSWAQRFAAGAAIRSGIEAGQLQSLPRADAEEALAVATGFVELVEREVVGRSAPADPAWRTAVAHQPAARAS